MKQFRNLFLKIIKWCSKDDKYGTPIAEFEEYCCPVCYSPRCDHNISDVNFSECRECGETFTLHNMKEKRVVIYEQPKKD